MSAGRVCLGRAVCSIALALLAWVPAASAQAIVGRVIDASNESGLQGALVTAQDPANGSVAARTITSASGRYRLAVSRVGEWRVKIAAIGFSPTTVDVTLGDSAAVAVPTVRLVPSIYQLPEIVAAARGSTCVPDQDGAPILARLIRETETALGLVQATIDSRELEFETTLWGRRTFAGRTDTLQATARARSRASWPITSAEHSLLQDRGFVHEDSSLPTATGYTENAGPVYYGPDANVLFSPWFLATHCFALDRQRADDSLRITFQPAARPSRPDVAGELVIDPRTMSLVRLEFRYVGMPRWVPAGEAGGEVAFRRLANGLWVVSSWRMRAPIRLEQGTQGRRGVTRFALGGWAENGGEVTEVITHP